MKSLLAGILLFGSSPVLAKTYEQIYPFSIEACALSQASPLNFAKEGPWGHSVLVLHGGCIYRRPGTPRVRPCQPENSIAVSVNSLLKNAQWLATEGSDFIFKGIVNGSQPLSVAELGETRDALIKSGVFKGMKIYTESAYGAYPGDINDPDTSKQTPEMRLAVSSLGIDTAFNYARNSYCARIPMPESVFLRLVRFLNQQNENYEKNQDFRWHFLFNNCAHLVHNALAAAGLWESKRTNAPFFDSLANHAIPSHEFIQAMRFARSSDYPKPIEIFKNNFWRTLVMRDHWLPFSPGVVARINNVLQPNFIFGVDLTLLVREYPWSPLGAEFRDFVRNPEYQDFSERLRRYQEIQRAALDDVLNDRQPLPSEGGVSYQAFKRAYADLLRKELINEYEVESPQPMLPAPDRDDGAAESPGDTGL